jgi:hypothetical protein
VTTLRYSRSAGCLASSAPQALQNRDPSGFSRLQAGHVSTNEAYDDRKDDACTLPWRVEH